MKESTTPPTYGLAPNNPKPGFPFWLPGRSQYISNRIFFELFFSFFPSRTTPAARRSTLAPPSAEESGGAPFQAGCQTPVPRLPSLATVRQQVRPAGELVVTVGAAQEDRELVVQRQAVPRMLIIFVVNASCDRISAISSVVLPSRARQQAVFAMSASFAAAATLPIMAGSGGPRRAGNGIADLGPKRRRRANGPCLRGAGAVRVREPGAPGRAGPGFHR